MSARFRGLTWDHPRGRDALTASGGDLVSWDVHPLEGFESHPVADLASRYDLVVLDHPHLGEAVATGCLTPLDDLFGPAELAGWDAGAAGPTMRSYRFAGCQWALPLDAATQVCATRPELVPDPPGTWAQVRELARRVPVALSLAGPHALLSFCSIAVSFGADPGADPDRFVTPSTGTAVLELMTELAASAPAGSAGLNPIGLLERMAAGPEIAAVPLVYGYVGYSGPVRFTDAPGGGSVLGGTGIAVSALARPDAELLDHLRWLLSTGCQRDFLPRHNGQPGALAAWTDPAVDRAAAGFYSGTARTLLDAWVRPRHAGWIPFQTEASAVVRDVLRGGLDPAAGLARIDVLHRAGLRTPEVVR